MAGRAAGRAAWPLLLCRLRHSSPGPGRPPLHATRRGYFGTHSTAGSSSLHAAQRLLGPPPPVQTLQARPGPASRLARASSSSSSCVAGEVPARPGLASGPVLNSQRLVAAYLLACAWAGRLAPSPPLPVASRQPAPPYVWRCRRPRQTTPAGREGYVPAPAGGRPRLLRTKHQQGERSTIVSAQGPTDCWPGRPSIRPVNMYACMYVRLCLAAFGTVQACVRATNRPACRMPVPCSRHG